MHRRLKIPLVISLGVVVVAAIAMSTGALNVGALRNSSSSSKNANEQSSSTALLTSPTCTCNPGRSLQETKQGMTCEQIVCPAGTTWTYSDGGKCIKSCPQGSWWDGTMCSRACKRGYEWDYQQHECREGCPIGTNFDYTSRTCISACAYHNIPKLPNGDCDWSQYKPSSAKCGPDEFSTPKGCVNFTRVEGGTQSERERAMERARENARERAAQKPYCYCPDGFKLESGKCIKDKCANTEDKPTPLTLSGDLPVPKDVVGSSTPSGDLPLLKGGGGSSAPPCP